MSCYLSHGTLRTHIDRLRTEAERAGDHETVGLCLGALGDFGIDWEGRANRAGSGQPLVDRRDACIRVILDAHAQRPSACPFTVARRDDARWAVVRGVVRGWVPLDCDVCDELGHPSPERAADDSTEEWVADTLVEAYELFLHAHRL